MVDFKGKVVAFKVKVVDFKLRWLAIRWLTLSFKVVACWWLTLGYPRLILGQGF